MKSTPNPLNPQGSLLEQEANGKPHLRVGLIIAGVHVLLFVGILIQGCGNETPGSSSADDAYSSTSRSQAAEEEDVAPPRDLNYYTSSNGANEDIALPGTAGASGVTGSSAMQPPQIGSPSVGESAPSPGSAPNLPGSSSAAGTVTEYGVQKGDSFYKIAQDHGISVSRLTEANASFDPKKLRPGQVLKIPSAAPAASRESVVPNEGGSAVGNLYVVKKGDTLSSIASANKTSVSQLKSTNGLKTDQIRVGQKLRIP